MINTSISIVNIVDPDLFYQRQSLYALPQSFRCLPVATPHEAQQDIRRECPGLVIRMLLRWAGHVARKSE